MIVEIANIPKGMQLNKWHRVREIDGLHVTGIYVRFMFVWDTEGNKLLDLPYGLPAYVDMEYNGTGYP